MEGEPDRYWQPPRRKRRLILKSLVLLVVLAVVFTGGVAVGRGDINAGFLSKRLPGKSSTAFDYSSVDQLYKVLKDDFDGNLDRNDLLDGIKSGLVSATGDPYTEYFNPQEAKDFNQALSGSFTGIGAELGTNDEGNVIIVSPLSGYPAEKAGLMTNDIIAEVDGQNTTGLRIDTVVHKIRGPADTKVKLTIIRGTERPFEVSITRTKIDIPSVKYQVDGRIGYIKINQFTDDTLALAKKAATEFKTKKVAAIVLDLRGNPGGYLDGAVDISSMWLEKGKVVVSERRGSTVLSTKNSIGSAEFKGLPTVVLINAGSASASEIVAGALRDNHAAMLVGVKSFGKGSVQQVERLSGGAELKVTIARWYTPGGKNIDKQGITPDIKVELSAEDQDAKRDPQKDRAYAILKSKI